jgi:DNA-binding response OmpR family regulator
MARILIIDDDDPLRSMLAKTLTGVGHMVVEACDGKQGLRIFSQTVVELVLTDIVMPEKDGLEVLMELRKLRPTVKIIAMSGGVRGSSADCLRLAQHLGAAKVLSKPFSIETLISAIDEMLPMNESPGRSPTMQSDPEIMAYPLNPGRTSQSDEGSRKHS